MIEKLIEFIREKGLNYSSFFLLYELVKENKTDWSEVYDDVSNFSNVNLYALQNDKYIKILNNVPPNIESRQRAINLINEADQLLLSDVKKPTKKVNKVDNEIAEWIEEFRNLFKGTKVGAKGDKKSCLEKMIRFFETYPEYADKDLIFKATENYIRSEAVNNNYKYLQRADYFIFKKTDREDTSRLAAFCDEVNDGVDNSNNILDLN